MTRSTAKRYRREVAAVLDREFRAGGARPDLSAFVEDAEDGGDDQRMDVDLGLVSDLIDHALGLELDDADLDRWLAHRLHYAVRIPRRLAADRGFWTWLTIEAGNEYVRHRWMGKNPRDPEVVTVMRYTGETLRNALSRLWWGAEMTRNGPSYADVPVAFARVRTAEFALELKYSWYRPAAIAFARVAEGAAGPGRVLGDEEMNDLSVRINSYLSLLALEALGFHETVDDEIDSAWWDRRPSLSEILGADELRGPEDRYADEDAIEALVEWFALLLADSPVEA